MFDNTIQKYFGVVRSDRLVTPDDINAIRIPEQLTPDQMTSSTITRALDHLGKEQTRLQIEIDNRQATLVQVRRGITAFEAAKNAFEEDQISAYDIGAELELDFPKR